MFGINWQCRLTLASRLETSLKSETMVQGDKCKCRQSALMNIPSSARARRPAHAAVASDSPQAHP